MKAKKLILLVCVVALILFDSILTSAATTGNERYDQQTSLQPMGTQFNYDDILSWTPESDIDARYNIANVPLAERKTGYVVNPYANPDAKMVLSGDAYPIGGGSTFSYGTEGEWRRYALNFWQYVDIYNFWGGPINLPTPELVDMAHKNGVPVVGTVFFENRNVANSERRIYYNRGTPENPEYPYGDKLWEIAEFYGFDGWFFNFESTGTDSSASQEIQNFLLYMQATKPNPNMILCMYDSPSTGGFLSRLTDTNRVLLQTDDGRRTGDYYFGDYKWTSRSYPLTTQSTARNSNPQIDPYRVTSSWPIHMNGYMTIGPGGSSDQLNGLMTQAPWLRHDEASAAEAGDPSLVNKAMNSLGIFGGHSPINLSSSASDFLNVQDPRLWVGYSGLATGDGPLLDPSEGYLGVGNGGVIDGVTINNANTDTAEAWYGFSQFLADKTVILDFPFATNFNPGIGDQFFVDGEAVKGAWTNRGIQDILPTWRWTVKTASGPKVTPTFDLTSAWYGAASLKLEGDVTAANEVRLYSTFLDFDVDTDYELTYVAKGTPVQFGFYTAEDYSAYTVPTTVVETGTENGWTTYTQDLSELKGKTIYGICIITDAGVVNANIGEIVIDKTDKGALLPPPTNLTLDGYLARDGENSEARIYWDAVDSDKLVKYEIYQVYENGSRRFLNATYAKAFFLSNITRDPDSPLVTLEVVAVDESLRKGGAASISFGFGMGEGEALIVPKPDNPNLVLDPDGTKFQYLISKENASEPGKALFDGDRVQSKWCVVGRGSTTAIEWRHYNGHYVIFDMGEPVTVSRWLTAHAGPVEALDFNTHTFSLAYIPVEYGDERDLHFDWETGVIHSGSANRNPPTAISNKFNLIRGTADGTTSPGIDGSNFYTRGNWVRVDRVVDNPRNEAGNIVDRDFADGPVTARYWMFLVERAMASTSNGALRVFELELYEHAKAITPSDSINTNQVKVVRGETSDSVYFKNIPYAIGTTSVNVYNSLDATDPIATGTRQPDGTAAITDLNLTDDGGRLYYDVQFEGYALSDRLSVAYDAKAPVKSSIPEISLDTARFSFDYNSVIPEIDGSLGYIGSPNVVNRYNSFFGALDVKLPEGSVMYLYDSQDDVFPSRMSAPVAIGASSTRIEALEFAKAGGYVWISAKEPGKAESGIFRLYYTGDKEVDYDASLQYALDTAPVLNEGDYFPHTWQNYIAKRTAAENALGQSAAAIVEAWNAWIEATNNLRPWPDEPTTDYLQELIDYGADNSLIEGHGILNSLQATINSIKRAEEAGDASRAINGLNALQNEVLALSGKKIQAEYATLILEYIDYLMDIIEANG